MKSVCVLALVLALPGCGGGGKSVGPGQVNAAASSAMLNGRAIFMTGVDSAGTKLTAVRPPLRPACAACHRANGSGGVHLPGGAASADLRHNALVTAQKHPYTVALLERAISTGVDNEGKPLNPVMPRWRMSKRDLHSVAQYVFSALK